MEKFKGLNTYAAHLPIGYHGTQRVIFIKLAQANQRPELEYPALSRGTFFFYSSAVIALELRQLEASLLRHKFW